MLKIDEATWDAIVEVCYVCHHPAGEGTITVNDRCLPLCDDCANWGYLRDAENPQRGPQWHQSRLQGAINAGIWGGWSRRPASDAER